jgi:hypothetical protein
MSSGIAAAGSRHIVEQRAGIAGVAVDRHPCLGNGAGGIAKPIGGAQPCLVVLIVKPPVHADEIVAPLQQAAELLQRHRLNGGRERVVAAGVAPQGGGGGGLAAGEQRPSIGKFALGAAWRVLGKIGKHRRGVAFAVPQRGLGAPPQ